MESSAIFAMNRYLEISRFQRLIDSPEALRAETCLVMARLALYAGRRVAARRWLWRALQIDPRNVSAWLILAALAAPNASKNYAQHALQLRPTDPIARAAFDWAQQRHAEYLINTAPLNSPVQ